MTQETSRQSKQAQAGSLTRPEHSKPTAGPASDGLTHYRIQVKGSMDVAWLKGFNGLAGRLGDECEEQGKCTVLHACTDQSGMVGLVRELHGLGFTIVEVKVAT